jgi:AcrR family transcriptional regulator
LLEPTILDAATAAFLADGYAATSIEAIARTSGIGKRTLYARWSGKPALFRAVSERLITRWLAQAGDWAETDSLEAVLNQAASRILAVALTPEAVALHRLLIAESARFPDLPLMLREAGANQGASRIAALLDRAVARGTLPAQDTGFAAEQFLHLVLAGPRRRALGLGRPLDEHQTDVWAKAAVALFLSGVRSA